MTVAEFFGCALLAFGPPLSMFVLTIANDPVRIIILVAAAFCWLLSLLFSSLIWFAVYPLRDRLAFGLFFSVLLQELFRYGIYKLLRRTESGLSEITGDDTVVSESKHTFAYVSGLGFGIISGLFALANVLADSIGPATVGLKSGSSAFFMTSALLTLCMILLHTFWGVIFFDALDEKNHLKIGWVVLSHLAVSGLTLLNKYQYYYASIIPAYMVLAFTMAIAYGSIGGSLSTFKNMFKIN